MCRKKNIKHENANIIIFSHFNKIFKSVRGVFDIFLIYTFLDEMFLTLKHTVSGHLN